MGKGSYMGVPIEELSREDLENALVYMSTFYINSLNQHNEDMNKLFSNGIYLKPVENHKIDLFEKSSAQFLLEAEKDNKNVKPGKGWL